MKSVLVVASAILLFFSLQAQAQTGVITQIRDNKALVDFDATDLLKVGDKLILQDSQCNQLKCQQPAASAVAEPSVPVQTPIVTPAVTTTSVNAESTVPEKPLRKREHNLAWAYSSVSSRSEITNNNATVSEINQTQTALEVSYLRNFGVFELGVFINTNSSEIEDDESTTAEVGVTGRINFIENAPGKDLIPYVFGSLSGVSIEYKTPGIQTVDGNGSAFSGGLGLLYYPFSELFALDVSIGASALKGVVDDTNIDIKIKQSFFNAGWRISF